MKMKILLVSFVLIICSKSIVDGSSGEAKDVACKFIGTMCNWRKSTPKIKLNLDSKGLHGITGKWFRIVSPTIKKGVGRCLFIDIISKKALLIVSTKVKDQENVLIQSSSNVNSELKIDISSSKDFQVYIKGYILSSKSEFTIKSVSLKDKPCFEKDVTVNCNFKKDYCQWKHEKYSSLEMKLEDESVIFGSKRTVSLSSPILDRTFRSCLSIDYSSNQNDLELDVKIQNINNETTLLYNHILSNHTTDSLPLSSQYAFKIIISGKNVKLHTITYSNSTCKLVYKSNDCNFFKGTTCNWNPNNDASYVFDKPGILSVFGNELELTSRLMKPGLKKCMLIEQAFTEDSKSYIEVYTQGKDGSNKKLLRKIQIIGPGSILVDFDENKEFKVMLKTSTYPVSIRSIKFKKHACVEYVACKFIGRMCYWSKLNSIMNLDSKGLHGITGNWLRILSPTIKKGVGRCLFIDIISKKALLTVSTKVKDQENVLIQSNSNVNSELKIDISSFKDFQVYIKGYISSSRYELTIKSVSLKDKPCFEKDVTVNCNFKKDYCQWKHEKYSSLEMKLEDESVIFGSKRTVSLSSPILDRTFRSCLSIDYSSNQNDLELDVKIQNINNETTLLYNHISSNHTTDSLPLSSQYAFKIIISGKNVKLHTITYSNSTCKLVYKTNDCNFFEGTTCNWNPNNDASYMFDKPGILSVFGNELELTSRLMKPGLKKCMLIEQVFTEDSKSYIEVYTQGKDGNNKKLLRKIQMISPGSILVDFDENKEFKVMLKTSTYPVSIRSIKFKKHACVESVDCSFKGQMCNWNNVAGKNGMRLESDGLHGDGVLWKYIESPLLRKTQGQCLIMKYSLKNSILEVSVASDPKNVISLNKFHTNGHFTAKMDFSMYKDFKIHIRSYTFSKSGTGVVVESVSLLDKPCFKKDVTVNCNFTDDYCQWKHKRYSPLEMKRKDGSVIFGSNDTVSLSSPSLDPTFRSCLSIDYSNDQDDLDLDVKIQNINNETTLLYNHILSNHTTDSLPLSSQYPFKIIISGRNLKLQSITYHNSTCNLVYKSNDCNFFEGVMCNWNANSVDNYKFDNLGIRNDFGSELELTSLEIKPSPKKCLVIDQPSFEQNSTYLEVYIKEKDGSNAKLIRKIHVTDPSIVFVDIDENKKSMRIMLKTSKSSITMRSVRFESGSCYEFVDCSFDGKMCNWKNAIGKSGMILDDDGFHGKKMIWTHIVSPLLEKTHSQCFVMEYELNNGILEASIAGNQKKAITLNRFTNNGRHVAKMDFSIYDDFKIIIRSFKFSENSRAIVKYVSLKDQSCFQQDKTLDCDFTDGYCKWQSERHSPNELILKNDSIIFGSNHKVTISSPSLDQTFESCLSVDLEYVDPDDHELDIKIETMYKDTKQLFNHMLSNHTTDFLPLSSNYPFKILISGRNVRIKSIRFSNDTCSLVYKTNDCNFYEGVLCKWKSKENNFHFNKNGIEAKWGKSISLTSSLMKGGLQQCMYIDQRAKISSSTFIEIYIQDADGKNSRLLRNVTTIVAIYGVIPVDLNEKNNFQITMKTSKFRYVLRSIKFKKGSCSSAADCVFDKTLCNWEISSHGSSSFNKDDKGLTLTKRSMLYSPIMPKTAGRCLKIFYSIFDTSVDVVMMRRNRESILLDTLLIANDTKAIPIESTDDYQIKFSTGKLITKSSKIILRDFILHPTPCFDSDSTIDCKFEGTFCNWLPGANKKPEVSKDSKGAYFRNYFDRKIYSKMQQPTPSSCILINVEDIPYYKKILHVSLNNLNGDSVNVFKKMIKKNNIYRVPISSKHPYQITVSGRNFKLQSITYYNSTCNLVYLTNDCNFFEGVTCKWNPNSVDNYKFDKLGIKNVIGSELELTTPVIEPSPKRCLVIDQSSFEQISSYLEVYIKDKDGSNVKLIRKIHVADPSIIFVDIDKNKKSMRIMLKTSKSSVTVRSVRFESGSCYEFVACSFNGKMCNWKNTIGKSGMNLDDYGFHGKKMIWTHIVSPLLEKTHSQCLVVEYELNSGILEASIAVNQKKAITLNTFYTNGRHVAKMDISIYDDFKIIIRSYKFSDNSRAIVKNVSLIDHSCFQQDKTLDCDFTDGYCKWQSERHSPNELILKNDSIIFGSNHKVTISSPSLDPTFESCLSVDLEYVDPDDHELDIKIETIYKDTKQLFNHMSSDHTTDFLPLSSNYPFKIMISGRNVRIKSIRFSNSTCTIVHKTNDCNFYEGELCKWKSKEDNFRFNKNGIETKWGKSISLTSSLMKGGLQQCMYIDQRAKVSRSTFIEIYIQDADGKNSRLLRNVTTIYVVYGVIPVDLNEKNNFQITMKTSKSRYVLRSIKFKTGNCSSAGDCVFDKTLCNWGTNSHGLSKLNLDDKSFNLRNRGMIVSPIMPKTAGRCLNIFYSIVDARVKVVMTRRNGDSILLDTLLTANDTKAIPIESTDDYQIRLSTGNLRTKSSKIAIRDVIFDPTPCFDSDSTIDCKFEGTFCNWQTSANRKPDVSKASKGAYFRNNFNGKINSKMLQPTPSSCMLLNLENLPYSIKVLHVYVNNLNGDSVNVIGKMTKKNNIYRVPISSKHPYQIIIVARGIRLFSVEFKNSPCMDEFEMYGYRCNFSKKMLCAWNLTSNYFSLSNDGITNTKFRELGMLSPQIKMKSPQCLTIGPVKSQSFDSALIVSIVDYKTSGVTVLKKYTHPSTEIYNITIQANVTYQIKLSSSVQPVFIKYIDLIPGPCILAGFLCDFDSSNCKYDLTGSTWHNGIDSKISVQDHGGSYHGGYMFMSNSGNSIATSRKYTTEKYTCIRFFYKTKNDFDISVAYKSAGTVSFTAMGLKSFGTRWAAYEFPLHQKNFQIIFKGNGKGEGGVAVDDVSITEDDNCYGNCDFDRNTCSWQVQNGHSKWKFMPAKLGGKNGGPITDATDSMEGGYLQLEGLTFQSAGSKSKIFSMTLTNTSVVKGMLFNYYMADDYVGKLNVYKREFEDDGTKQQTLLWTLRGNQGPGWQTGQLPLTIDKPTVIVIEGVHGRNREATIYIDNVLFLEMDTMISPSKALPKNMQTTTLPTTTTAMPAKILSVCRFNKTLCNWKNNFLKRPLGNWRLWSQKAHKEMLPINDHTGGKSSYVYVSFRQAQQEEAILHYDGLRGENCLKFWYYYKGRGRPSLTIVDTKTRVMPKPVYARNWMFYELTIGSSNIQYSVKFSANSEDRGVIALDDIVITEGSCKVKPGICNFEGEECEWKILGMVDQTWKIQSGESENYIGPVKDHTRGDIAGHYASVTSKVRKGVTSWYLSQPFPPTQKPGCLEFYYHMFGTDIGTLKVIYQSFNEHLTLWSLTNVDTKSKWLRAAVPIQSNGDYQLIFKALRGSGQNGDISIDDISLQFGGKCVLEPPIADPSVTIPSQISCNFDEGNHCEWKPITKMTFWSYSTTKKYTVMGPEQVHPPKPGMFTYFRNSEDANEVLTMSLQSPLLSNPYGTVGLCLSFYYYMLGNKMDGSNITIQYMSMSSERDVGETTHLSVVNPKYLDFWYRYSYHLEANFKSDFKIGLTFNLDRGNDVMAIDDISITIGKCAETDTCSFENGNCLWHGTMNRFNEYSKILIADHSTSSKLGHGLLAKPTIKKPVMMTREFKHGFTGTKCFSFWFLNTGKSSHLSLILKEGSNPDQTMWYWKHRTRTTWQYGQANILSRQKFILKFVASTKTELGDDFVALDDFRFTFGACKSMDTCDFSKSFCRFSNSDSNKFNWIIGHGLLGNQSVVAAPLVDHTYSSIMGMFAYADLTDDRIVKNERISLSSGVLYSDSSVCINFYYICDGIDLPKLQLVLLTESNIFKTIWTSEAVSIKEWSSVKKTFRDNGKFELFFEAIKQDGNRAFIAIDDVSINLNCIETTTIPVITAKPDVAKFWCNFTDGTSCILKPGSSNWKNTKATKYGNGLSPVIDAEYEYDGRFMMSEFSLGKNTFMQVKNMFFGEQRLCLSFWYYYISFRKSSKFSLQLFSQQFGNGMTSELIWQPQISVVDEWRHSKLTISGFDQKNFNLKFMVLADAEENMGVAAIDDLSLIYDECHRPVGLFSIENNFDNGHMAGYQQDLEHRWNTVVPRNKFDDLLDHTTGSSSGTFLYYHSNVTASSNKLISPFMKPIKDVCLKFWYILPTSSIYQLSVHISTEDRVGLAEWKSQKNNVPGWHTAQLTLTSEIDFQVLFLVNNLAQHSDKVSSSNIVALDDISVTDSPCLQPATCTFENGFCNWLTTIPSSINDNHAQSSPYINNLMEAEARWIRLTGGHMNSMLKEDGIEASYKNNDKFIIFYPKRMGNKAILLSEMIKPTMSGCFSFLAYGNSNKTISFNLYALMEDTIKPISKKINVPYTGKKTEIVVDFTSDDLLKNDQIQLLLIAAAKSSDINDFMVITSIDWSREKCPSDERFQCDNKKLLIDSKKVCDWKVDCKDRSDEKYCGNCPYTEKGFCGWKNTGSASVSISIIGKLRGIFYQSGVLQLVSPVLQPAVESCQLSFTYMTQNYLLKDVYVAIRYDPFGVNITYNVWKSLKPLGTQDTGIGVLNIGHVNSEFQVVIVSTGDSRYRVFFDITFDNCYPQYEAVCGNGYFHCTNSSECVSKDKVCDFSHDCLDGSDEDDCGSMDVENCNFEISTCGWSNEQTGKERGTWHIISPSKSNFDYQLPQRDHTKNLPLGHYLQSVDESARLAGPIFEPSSTCKMRIYYSKSYAKGKIEQLQVATRTTSNSELKEVWKSTLRMEDDYGILFFKRKVVEFHETEPFQVVLISRLEKKSAIAVDDISFSSECKLHKEPLKPTSLPPVIPSVQCKSSEFKCKKPEKCIPINEMCDFIRNCKDGSDEENCGSCDFENGICSWTSASSSSAWNLVEASSKTDPTTDSTTLSAGGHYIGSFNKDSKIYKSFYSEVKFRSPVFGPTGPDCTFFFDYNIAEFSRTYIQMIVKFSSGNGHSTRNPHIYLSSSKGKWMSGQMAIKTFTKKIYILIRGSYMTNTANVALDNFRLSNCGPKHENVTGVSCTFENGYCDWKVIRGDGKNRWERQYPSNDVVGPKFDRNHEKSYYLYLRSFKKDKFEKSYLNSKQLPRQASYHCLTFWYYMFGEHVGNLSVNMIQYGRQTEVFNRFGSLGDIWNKGSVEVPPVSKPFWIQFEGDYNSFSYGGIAIDDIVYSGTSCPSSPNFCNFQGEVGWSDDDDKWFVTNGKGNLLIDVDHTWRNNLGKFAMLASVGKHSLKSPMMDVLNERICFSFWMYNTNHDTAVVIRLLASDQNVKPVEIYNNLNSNSLPKIWLNVRKTLTLNFKGQYQISIDGIIGKRTVALAVDDILISQEECRPKGNCNFEVDICDWFIDESPTFARWLRMSVYIPTNYDGPRHDVTTHSTEGWYLLVEAEKDNIGKAAYLTSDSFEPTNKMCISFYYIISKEDIGILQLLLNSPIDHRTAAVKTLSKKTNDWHQVSLQLDSNHATIISKSKFLLVFKASIKKSGGYIAIDEISIEKSCSKMTTLQPTTLKPKVNLNCDFETKCSWKLSSNWIYTKPNASCGHKCPLNDHTLRSPDGTYLTMSSDKNTPEVASLELNSPPDTSDGYCLKFWYYMSAYHYNTVITIHYQISGKSYTLLAWEAYGIQDLIWKLAHVSIKSTERITKIELSTSIYDRDLEQISIDDLSLSFGSCSLAGGYFCSFDIQCSSIVSQYGIRMTSLKSLKIEGKDHTSGKASGGVMAFFGNNEDSSSFSLKVKKGVRCIQFWYRFFSKSTGDQITVGSSNLIYISITDVGYDEWMFEQVTITSNYKHDIFFSGRRKSSSNVIAIDDFSVNDNECQKPGYCNFDMGSKCGWTNSRKLQLRWIIASPVGLKNNKFPSKDVTTNSSEGYLLALEPLAGVKLPSWAALKSQFFADKFYRKVSFYYYIYGGNLKLLVRDGKKARVVWKSKATGMKQWKSMEYTLDVQANFELVIMANILNADDFMAIDEIQVLSQKSPFVDESTFDCRDGKKSDLPLPLVCNFVDDCSNGRDEAVCGTCNFEEDTCGWTSQSSYRVSAQSDHTPNHPVRDHTLTKQSDKGHYVVMRVESKVPLLVGPTSTMKRSSPGCEMTFWLASDSSGQSTIDVFVAIEGYGLEGLRYRDEALANTSNQWLKHTVDIGSIHKGFRVKIVAMPFTYVAVDDIKFEGCAYPGKTDGACLPGQTKCRDSEICIDQSAICNTVNDCGDFSDETACNETRICTLQEDNTGCYWTPVEQSNNYKWHINFRKLMDDSGPATGHTIGLNGDRFYIAGPSSRQEEDSLSSPTSYLLSNRISVLKGKTCQLRFFFYMFGKDIGSLSVETAPNLNGKWFEAWSKRGDNGQKWRKGVVNFPDTHVDGFFVFKSTAIKGGRANAIALDDITLSDGCVVHVEQDDNMFKCGTGSLAYVDRSVVCDFKLDCDDGSDERGCPTRCNFDKGDTCGWTVSSNRTVQTIKASTGPSIAKDLPRVDHTLKDKNGFYVLFDDAKDYNLTANSMTSPTFGNSSSECFLSFWFVTKGFPIEITLVYVDPMSIPGAKDGRLEIGHMNSDIVERSNDWQYAKVGIGRRNARFSIKISTHEFFALVIDDIGFEKCALPKRSAGKCPDGRFLCKTNGACIDRRLVCDLSDDCGDGSDEGTTCDSLAQHQETFENASKSIFYQPKKSSKGFDLVDWKLATASEPESPAYDHTLLDHRGHFMMTDFGPNDSSDRQAWLITEHVYGASTSSSPCFLTFYYSMYDINAKALAIYAKFYEDDMSLNEVWIATGYKGQIWIRERREIVLSRPFRLIFVASSPGNYNGQIAIDDITFHSSCRIVGKKLPHFPTEPTTTSSTRPTTSSSTRPTTTSSTRQTTTSSTRPTITSSTRPTTISSTRLTTTSSTRPTTISSKKPVSKTTMTNPFVKSSMSPKTSMSPFPDVGFHCQGPKGIVISAFYRCDGVPDCPNGDDETINCPAKRCDMEGMYCKDGINGKCIDSHKICNGKNDCSDGSDEALCNRCPRDYCKNGATCTVKGSLPNCICKPGTMGYRCFHTYIPRFTTKINNVDHTVKSGARQADKKPNKLGKGSIAGLVIGIIAFVALILGATYLFYIRKSRSTGEGQNPLVRNMVNPMYESDMIDDQEFKMQDPIEDDDEEKIRKKKKKKKKTKEEDTSKSIENPLYDTFSDLDCDTNA